MYYFLGDAYLYALDIISGIKITKDTTMQSSCCFAELCQIENTCCCPKLLQPYCHKINENIQRLPHIKKNDTKQRKVSFAKSESCLLDKEMLTRNDLWSTDKIKLYRQDAPKSCLKKHTFKSLPQLLGTSNDDLSGDLVDTKTEDKCIKCNQKIVYKSKKCKVDHSFVQEPDSTKTSCAKTAKNDLHDTKITTNLSKKCTEQDGVQEVTQKCSDLVIHQITSDLDYILQDRRQISESDKDCAETKC